MFEEKKDEDFKARVVALILNSDTEKAIEILSQYYHVEKPGIGVGVFPGKTKGVKAVYDSRRKEILASRREYFTDPFTVLHEFYHHLRSTTGKHRGTERHANLFAYEFIAAFNRKVGESSRGK
jgi:Zn-dependent peptidase ImmA (M78 family)